MADFNALTALINAYIKQNGVKAITGQILNGVLRGMVSALGKGYTVAGEASPTTVPGTMTGPVAYIAHTAGTYEHFGNLVVAQGEVAMLIYDEAVWRKDVLLSLSANATVDANVGTPEVTCTFVDGVLTFDFRNMKGNPGVDGDPAGFGAVTATVDANVGTPGVSVQTSGPDTAKNITFQFTNLKGETGVTSCVVTVDNTTGTPSCAVSLVGQELHLDFSGLKGAQGNTGSSVDYPFEIVNNLTTNDATKALSAAMGVQLESEVSQLEAKVTDISTESTEDDEEKIQVVSDDGQTVYLEISHNGVNAKNLKSNGEQVLTPTTGATKTELNAKQDIIQEIQREEIIEELSEQEWCSDDYDGNGNGEIYARVNEDGISAKDFKRLDGAYVLFAPLFGKKIRIFGGSVAFLLDKYTGGNIIRSTGATLTDDAQSGAGFANNLSLVDGAIVYSGVSIQKQVDDATAAGQVKADIYILWASTNDYTTASIQVGDNEDYTIADNFDVSARLTQCGGINYCIKKLCEFAPEAKVVVFGSLKCFGNPGGGWTEGGCGLAGRLKALVDGQHECAMRSSLPFLSLWENSGFNEYNNNTYFYHGDDDMYYPAGHGNDGTHPNKEGYIYLANKIINFLNTI